MPDRPKKILYAITKANWGGAQRYVYDLAVAAQGHGHDVAVVVGGTGVLTEKLSAAGVRTISLALAQRRTFIGDLLTFGPLLSLIKIFQTERPDVIHVNSAKASGLGALAGRIAHVPHIIFTAHGWEFNAPRNAISKIGIRLFSWLTILLSHKTICVSSAIRNDVAWMPFTKNKLLVIRNGITCEPLQPREEARMALNRDSAASYWIGMISELHPTKRVDDAIRAFAHIASKRPETELLIIGDGKERTKLEELICALHLEGRVSLLGHVTDAQKYLSAFDVFVHASISEALGYVILEAGCASLPVIATRVGGIPEIIQDRSYGILVPPRSPEALADAIESLICDPMRAAELGARLHDRVQESFSKQSMLSQTFAQY